MSDPKRGLFNKFVVTRAEDYEDGPGKKHGHCEYFVLDINHDKFAADALYAYAKACFVEYTTLSGDLAELAYKNRVLTRELP